VWTFHIIRAELQTAQELGEQLLTLAQSTQDSEFLVKAHYTLGVTLQCLGEFAPAHETLEQGISFYDPHKHGSLAFRYGQDPGVACRSHSASILWGLGYPDQALKRAQEALTLAQGLSHPSSLAYCLTWSVGLHLLRREGQAAQERAEALIALATEQGFLYFLALGTIWQGCVLAMQGQGEEGIPQIHRGLAAYRATGAEFEYTYFLALLAEAYGKVGRAAEGLTALAEALVTVDKTGERDSEAELYRLKGELTLQASAQSTESSAHEAEGYFRKAIAIARQQQTKSWELRASTSLARLWQRQDKREDARQLLAEIYGWFREGFDTKDLQDARALLDELP
jgi:predicted ATPase